MCEPIVNVLTQRCVREIKKPKKHFARFATFCETPMPRTCVRIHGLKKNPSWPGCPLLKVRISHPNSVPVVVFQHPRIMHITHTHHEPGARGTCLCASDSADPLTKHTQRCFLCPGRDALHRHVARVATWDTERLEKNLDGTRFTIAPRRLCCWNGRGRRLLRCDQGKETISAAEGAFVEPPVCCRLT